MGLMRLEYDEEADAAYIWIREGVARAFGVALDDSRYVDYADDRAPVGIELLNVRRGVDVADLPERAAVERLLGESHLPIFA